METPIDQQTFSDNLVEAVFSKNLEPYFEDNLIERTFSTLRELVTSSESRALVAREHGDEDMYRRASAFKRQLQSTLAANKYRLAEYHRRMTGTRPAGSTLWRRFAMDCLDLIEEAVDLGVIGDDALHDRFVDVLDKWEQGAYRKKD